LNVNPGGGTATFAPSLAGDSIDLGIEGNDTYGPSALAITGSVEIDGLGGSRGVTIDPDTAAAPPRLRVFSFAPLGSVTLKNLTLSGGLAAGGNSQGGGGGAGLGGAIVDAGTLNVIACTFDGNKATGGNSTVGSSGASGGGGGLGGDGSGLTGGPPDAGV